MELLGLLSPRVLTERESGFDLHGEEMPSSGNGKLWENGGETGP